MRSLKTLAAGAFGALALTCAAQAQTPIYTSGSLVTYWYPSGTNEGSIVFGNFFVNTGGGTQLNVEQLKFYVYRLATSGALTPVTLNLYLTPMTYNGTAFVAGTDIPMGTVNFAADAATANQVWTVTTPLGSTAIPLEIVSNPGLGGFLVGGKFSGANSAAAKNAFLFAGAPTLGASFNRFALRSSAGVFTAWYWFGTDTAGAEIAARLACDVSGVIADAPPPANPCDPANIILGQSGFNVVTLDSTYPGLDLAGYCTGDLGSNTVIAKAKYVQYTPSRSGSMTVRNCTDSGTGVDSRMAVLTQCGNAATAIACDDDGCTAGAAPYTSSMTFSATAGTTYYFAIGGYSVATPGPFNVEIVPPAAPPCPADLNADGAVNGADLGLMLGSWGNCPQIGACAADLNADGVVNGADLGLLLGSWGNCPA